MVVYLSLEKSIKSYYRLSKCSTRDFPLWCARGSHQMLEFMFDYRRGVVSFKFKLRIRKQITLAICINNLTIDRLSQGRFQQTFEWVNKHPNGWVTDWLNGNEAMLHSKCWCSVDRLSKFMQFGHIRSKQANLNAQECAHIGCHSTWITVIERESYQNNRQSLLFDHWNN